MKRTSAWISLILVGGLVAACSSSNGAASPKLCALASGCLGLGSFIPFGALCQGFDAAAHDPAVLLGNDNGPISEELTCIEAASDCASMAACLTVPASAAAACHGTQSVCSNGYAVECGGPPIGGKTPGSNCAGAGLVCAEDSNGAACGSASCDPATTRPTCDGDNVVTCSEPGGALTTMSCKGMIGTACSGSSSGGSSCQTLVADTCAVVNGTAQCVGSGAACDASKGGNTCNGTSIVACAGGKTASFDCSLESPDATCQVQSDGSAQCVGTGTQCTAETPETCANGVITYCMWGTKTTVDCKAYGLSGCTTFTSSPGTTGASCTP
jgi:hypothetical protein